MLVYGHRGYSAKYPENTLLAFQKAIEYGADGIELDVHLTKDKKIVVCHDETIDRTFNGEGLISEMTLEELRKYNSHGQKIPTLDEVFDLIGPVFRINVELKTDVIDSDELVEKTVKFIKTRNPDRVLVSSFNHKSISYARKLDQNLKLGFLFDKNHIDKISEIKKKSVELGIFSYNLPVYAKDLKEMDDIIEFGKDKGIKIIFWTVNDKAEMEYAIEKEAYMVITNEVELIKNILKERLES
jgi:glycerophosphoryl diester phosphodiesterase